MHINQSTPQRETPIIISKKLDNRNLEYMKDGGNNFEWKILFS